MAEITTLKAVGRDKLGTAHTRRLRRDGFVPGVLYGKKRDVVHLALAADELARAMRGNARIFKVELPGGLLEPVLIKEVQYDAISDEVRHIDFGRIDLDEFIDVRVSLKLIGTARGVQLGGRLETGSYNVLVSCRADSVPEEMRIDISELGVGETIRVKDLPVTEHMTILSDAEAVVVACKAPQEAEEEAAETPEGEEPASAEPEVIARGRKEEGEEG